MLDPLNPELEAADSSLPFRCWERNLGPLQELSVCSERLSFFQYPLLSLEPHQRITHSVAEGLATINVTLLMWPPVILDSVVSFWLLLALSF